MPGCMRHRNCKELKSSYNSVGVSPPLQAVGKKHDSVAFLIRSFGRRDSL